MNFDDHIESDWPVHPRWLSLKNGVSEDKANPNSEGIFNFSTLHTFVADASDHKNIENPLTLFQVIPNSYVYENEDNRIQKVESKDIYINNILDGRSIIRIDPGHLYQNIKCCETFRKCNNCECEQKCFNLDSRIALFYHEKLDGIHYFGDNEHYIDVFNAIVDEYNNSLHDDNAYTKVKVYTYKVFDKKNSVYYYRIYARYRCKYSGFDEYFFPIFHYGKVIAVLMQGQRPNEDLINYPMFKDYISDLDNGRKLNQSIEKLRKNKRFMKDESLSDIRRDAIFDRIIFLARKINDTVNAYTQKYVSTQFSKIEEVFRSKIKEIIPKEESAFEKYEIILNKTLEDIFNKFNREGFIRIYFITDSIKNGTSTVDKFKLIGDSKYSADTKDYKILKFENLPTKDTIDKEELIEFLIDNRNLLEPKDILRMEIAFIHRKSYVVWKRYSNEKGKYVQQRMIYGDTLKMFYHVLLEPYILLNEIATEELLEKSIRLSVHETSQVIPSIIQSLNRIIDKKIEIDNENNQEETINEIKNIISRIELLNGLFTRSTMIFKKVDPEYEWVSLTEIISTIKTSFDQKAFLNNKQKIEIQLDDVFTYSEIYTDKKYIYQILFNLVDNAIKYGIRGSIIYISIKADNNNKEWLKYGITNYLDEIKISIENYGDIIDASLRKNMFTLYHRSVKHYNIEGMGIGLFLVNKLCEGLGYEINCKDSEFVENLNLPIYYHYLLQKGIHSLDKFILLSQEDKLRIDFNTKRIVNSNENINWHITKYEIIQLLKHDLYKNTFEITIPTNNNNFKITKLNVRKF